MMRRTLAISAAMFAIVIMTVFGSFSVASPALQDDAVVGGGVQFVSVDLRIDTGNAALAAWQVEFDAPQTITIVGIENGEHAAFRDEPPHYDPAAMMNDRIILADFSLNDPANLPAGSTRIATLHLQITGDGDLEQQLQKTELKLTAAADSDGNHIAGAMVTFERGDR